MIDQANFFMASVLCLQFSIFVVYFIISMVFQVSEMLVKNLKSAYINKLFSGHTDIIINGIYWRSL